MLIIFTLLIGCSSKEVIKEYTEKNRPLFNDLANQYDKVAQLGLTYDINPKHIEEYLKVSKQIKEILPMAITTRNETEINSSLEELDNNYTLFLKDTQKLMGEENINKIIIYKNYLLVADKMEEVSQRLTSANQKEIINIEESLLTSWQEAKNNIQELNQSNQEVKAGQGFTNEMITALEQLISSNKSNQQPTQSLGIINTKAIEKIKTLKEDLKKNQIDEITYLLGLIKTIDNKWSALPKA